ncbi:MAG: acyltransferase [Candidatus Symbiothrix sp.]|jgi:peptidoglycan/LPS O-acetylase OafA/YrhL|nr:acyltransferase [Candidatus Symbiothrix sp.]
MNKIFFITFLRALAAIVITNSHYTGVYPSDIIANGGLLGDVLFFAVSGYCLCNIRIPFLKWYLKRIIRIYPIVFIITVIYLLLGFYSVHSKSLLWWFVYPTNYHFVASIIVLYIPFYFLLKWEKSSNKIPFVLLFLIVIQVIIYIFFYDKSYYHIDKVREPMIRFLFFEAMLLGAYMKINNNQYMNRNKWYNWLIMFALLIVYFVSKMIFVKYPTYSHYQILNQFVLFVLLFYVMKCVAGLDAKLTKLPNKAKKAINYLAEWTLEIYVVQYVIIPRLVHFAFPLNWVLITTTILVAAGLLHYVSRFVINRIEKQINKVYPLQ